MSVTSQLDLRRYEAAGDRAYELGTEDGRFPAMGFHTRGEMGGIWTPPIKLLDGIWFGVNGQWIGPATKFTSGFGYVQMALPATGGVQLTRTDFAPDGRRAVEFGLTLTAGSQAANVNLNVDAHSELMSAYPWGSTTPDQTTFNLPDQASFNGKQLVFTDTGTPPVANAAPHSWAAIVGATGLTPASGTTGTDFRGPQDPPVICPVSSQPDIFRCDDTAYGKGAGGELTYPVRVPAGASRTIWFTVAGSDNGTSDAQAQFQAASANPAAELAAKIASRLRLNSQTQVSLPGDPALAESVTWSKQDMADLTQQADNLQIRDTEQGTVYPPPLATVPSIRFEGAGFPDYPWMFATDQEYTMFALLAAGQFATAEDGLRSLAEVSDIANNKSGKVVHETVTDGSVYYGLNDEPGDIDETAKFPDAVAMVWRWTGDNRFRDQLYDFVKRNMQYMIGLVNGDDDLWPDGAGNVESSVLGADAVDVAVYTIRGLYDLADMAASKGDTATQQWADSHAAAMVQQFSADWWMPSIPQFADSLVDPANTQMMQRFWTAVTPMEAQLYPDGVFTPGLVPPSEALPALKLRETSCYSGTYGLYEGGAPGCDPGTYQGHRQNAFTVNTGVMAVGLGNYGLLGPGDQQRYTDDLATLQLGSVAEQPGAMPEIGPSPDFPANITHPFNERSSVNQAWGTYGVLWPVVNQQLGVTPQLGNGLLEVLPDVPPGQSSVSGTNIRAGRGSIDVAATHYGSSYTTTVTARLACTLHVGATLPAGAQIHLVTLNGSPARYTVRDTNAGRQVLVSASCGARTWRVHIVAT
ncbi:MAG: glycogen debranching protein [Actinobacteria bacterium]|nr:glycogen debranching protein [Actinomycetota bacterium]